MTNASEFEKISPIDDSQLRIYVDKLIADPTFQKIEQTFFPTLPLDAFAKIARSCKTKLEFQKAFCYPFLKKIIKEHTDGVKIDTTNLCPDDTPCTYISNHRDIILDSGFLDIMMVDCNRDTVEIAIGDNLLIYPWIDWFVRINKSFIVQRQLGMRQMLESSILLSRYMHYCINEKLQSIWIAQREGRAKDSNDLTQEGVLKMFTMGGEGDIIDRLMQLNIVPLTISYEYDPCDYLKAKEFQQKLDSPEFKKSQQDDLLNMATGVTGYKGRVVYRPAQQLNNKLALIDHSLPKAELFTQITKLIDRDIHSNYEMYPVNYIALDQLEGTARFTDKYSEADKAGFNDYLYKQIAKIDLEQRNETFLRTKMLEMYANPLRNYLKAKP